MQTIPFTDVRAHLADTLRDLEGSNEPVFISRRGQPAAVLMSMAQYERLTGPEEGFGAALRRWRAEHADELAAAVDEPDPFANLRDPDPDGGRPPLDWMAILGEQAGDPPAGPPPKRGLASVRKTSRRRA